MVVSHNFMKRQGPYAISIKKITKQDEIAKPGRLILVKKALQMLAFSGLSHGAFSSQAHVAEKT